MQPIPLSPNDAALVGRLIKPDHGDFSPETAREILSLQFDSDDQERMQRLSLKVQAGALTPEERAEIESYRRVGYLLGVLWSRARLSLKRAGMDAPNGNHA